MFFNGFNKRRSPDCDRLPPFQPSECYYWRSLDILGYFWRIFSVGQVPFSVYVYLRLFRRFLLSFVPRLHHLPCRQSKVFKGYGSANRCEDSRSRPHRADISYATPRRSALRKFTPNHHCYLATARRQQPRIPYRHRHFIRALSYQTSLSPPPGGLFTESKPQLELAPPPQSGTNQKFLVHFSSSNISTKTSAQSSPPQTPPGSTKVATRRCP